MATGSKARKRKNARERLDRTRPRCDVAICDRPAGAFGWCPAHRERWRRTGDLRAHIPILGKVAAHAGAVCAATRCEELVAPSGARGYCAAHNWRIRAHGTPNDLVPIGGLRKNRQCDLCDEPHVARGLCRVHYDAKRNPIRRRRERDASKVKATKSKTRKRKERG